MIKNLLITVNIVIVHVAQIRQSPIIFKKWMERSYQKNARSSFRILFTFQKPKSIFQKCNLLVHIKTENATTWTNIQYINSLIKENFLSI